MAFATTRSSSPTSKRLMHIGECAFGQRIGFFPTLRVSAAQVTPTHEGKYRKGLNLVALAQWSSTTTGV